MIPVDAVAMRRATTQRGVEKRMTSALLMPENAREDRYARRLRMKKQLTKISHRRSESKRLRGLANCTVHGILRYNGRKKIRVDYETGSSKRYFREFHVLQYQMGYLGSGEGGEPVRKYG